MTTMNVDDEFTCRYTVIKHSWKGKYARIFAVGPRRVATININSLSQITNSWDYDHTLVDVDVDSSSTTQFSVIFNQGRKVESLLFECACETERADLMTAVQRHRGHFDSTYAAVSARQNIFAARKHCAIGDTATSANSPYATHNAPQRSSSSAAATRPVNNAETATATTTAAAAARLSVTSGSTPMRAVLLCVNSFGIVQMDPQRRYKVGEYLYMHIKAISVLPFSGVSIVVLSYGPLHRQHCYDVENAERFVQLVREYAARYIGVRALPSLEPGLSRAQFAHARLGWAQHALYHSHSSSSSAASAVITRSNVEFAVRKMSMKRAGSAVARLLSTTSSLLLERDPGTGVVVCAYALRSVFYLVRPEEDEMEFAMVLREPFQVKWYVCPMRDAVLAHVIDRCRNATDVCRRVVTVASSGGGGVRVKEGKASTPVTAMATPNDAAAAAAMHTRSHGPMAHPALGHASTAAGSYASAQSRTVHEDKSSSSVFSIVNHGDVACNEDKNGNVHDAICECAHDGVFVVTRLINRSKRACSATAAVSGPVERTLLRSLAHADARSNSYASHASANTRNTSVSHNSGMTNDVSNQGNTLDMTRVTEYFNANVDYNGLRMSDNEGSLFADNREKLIHHALEALLMHYPDNADNFVCVQRFYALRRLSTSRSGFGHIATTPSLAKALGALTARSLPPQPQQQQSACLSHAVIDFLNTLMTPHHDQYDTSHAVINRHLLLRSHTLVQTLLHMLRSAILRHNHALLLSSLLDFFVYALCPPYSEFTEEAVFVAVLRALNQVVGHALLRVLRHPCLGIRLAAARLLRVAIEEESEEGAVAQWRRAALAEAAYATQFHVAAFGASATHRDMARRLLGHWTCESPAAQDLLRRMLPAGLLYTLQSSMDAPEDGHSDDDEYDCECHAMAASTHTSIAATADCDNDNSFGNAAVGSASSGLPVCSAHDKKVLTPCATSPWEKSVDAEGWPRRTFFPRREGAGGGPRRLFHTAATFLQSKVSASYANAVDEQQHQQRSQHEGAIGVATPALRSAASSYVQNDGEATHAPPTASFHATPDDDVGNDYRPSAGSTHTANANSSSMLCSRRVRRARRSTSLNWNFLFYTMRQHSRTAELIWNRHTRDELRRALEMALEQWEQQQQQHEQDEGLCGISWNYHEFHVVYHSLVQELMVGSYYPRLLFQVAGRPSLAQPRRVFDALYHRFLLERRRGGATAAGASYHSDPCSFSSSTWTSQGELDCLHGMTVLYTHYSSQIGVFEDVAELMTWLDTTTEPITRDRMLLFVASLTRMRQNMRMLLAPESMRVLLDLVTLAHLGNDNTGETDSTGPTSDEVGEMYTIAPETAEWYCNVTCSASSCATGRHDPQGPPPPQQQQQPSSSSPAQHHEALSWRQLRTRYSDSTHTASSSHISRTAPSMDAHTLVCGPDQTHWQPLHCIPQLRWGLVAAGKPALLSYSAVTCTILDVLLQLCEAYPMRDEYNHARVHPAPTIQRILTGGDVLPHLVQLLLTLDSAVCARVHRLLGLLLQDGPERRVFYRTGFFLFALMYAESDVLPLARLLYLTHTAHMTANDTTTADVPIAVTAANTMATGAAPPRRHHEPPPGGHDGCDGRESTQERSGSSAIRGDTESERWVDVSAVVRCSMLAPLLPPTMIYVLVRHGPERFADIFLGEWDTPEAIWGAAMREHLTRAIASHLRDFIARLRGCHRQVYHYCPIPPVCYPALQHEMFCGGYYLRHLCDEQRFPHWPIADPARLLSELLAAWRAEQTAPPPPSTSTRDACLRELELFDLMDAKEGTDDGNTLSGASVQVNTGDGGMDTTSDEKGSDDHTSCSVSLGSVGKRAADRDDAKEMWWRTRIRRAYLDLATRYHPDKNPHGRERFGRVHDAYMTLMTHSHQPSSSRCPNAGAAMSCVGESETGGSSGVHAVLHRRALLLRAQRILFRRCGSVLRHYRYAGYAALVAIMREAVARGQIAASKKTTTSSIPSPFSPDCTNATARVTDNADAKDDTRRANQEHEQLDLGKDLMLQCAVALCAATLYRCPGNVEELYECGGVTVLLSLMVACMHALRQDGVHDDYACNDYDESSAYNEYSESDEERDGEDAHEGASDAGLAEHEDTETQQNGTGPPNATATFPSSERQQHTMQRASMSHNITTTTTTTADDNNANGTIVADAVRYGVCPFAPPSAPTSTTTPFRLIQSHDNKHRAFVRRIARHSLDGLANAIAAVSAVTTAMEMDGSASTFADAVVSAMHLPACYETNNTLHQHDCQQTAKEHEQQTWLHLQQQQRTYLSQSVMNAAAVRLCTAVGNADGATALRFHLMRGGVMWFLLRDMLCYDASLGKAAASMSLTSAAHCRAKRSNAAARSAARALRALARLTPRALHAPLCSSSSSFTAADSATCHAHADTQSNIVSLSPSSHPYHATLSAEAATESTTDDVLRAHDNNDAVSISLRKAMAQLLMPSIARALQQGRVTQALRWLTASRVETPHLVWNESTRGELTALVATRIAHIRSAHGNESNSDQRHLITPIATASAAISGTSGTSQSHVLSCVEDDFVYHAHRTEPVLCGIFLRVYIAQANAMLDEPGALCDALFESLMRHSLQSKRHSIHTDSNNVQDTSAIDTNCTQAADDVLLPVMWYTRALQKLARTQSAAIAVHAARHVPVLLLWLRLAAGQLSSLGRSARCTMMRQNYTRMVEVWARMSEHVVVAEAVGRCGGQAVMTLRILLHLEGMDCSREADNLRSADVRDTDTNVPCRDAMVDHAEKDSNTVGEVRKGAIMGATALHTTDIYSDSSGSLTTEITTTLRVILECLSRSRSFASAVCEYGLYLSLLLLILSPHLPRAVREHSRRALLALLCDELVGSQAQIRCAQLLPPPLLASVMSGSDEVNCAQWIGVVDGEVRHPELVWGGRHRRGVAAVCACAVQSLMEEETTQLSSLLAANTIQAFSTSTTATTSPSLVELVWTNAATLGAVFTPPSRWTVCPVYRCLRHAGHAELDTVRDGSGDSITRSASTAAEMYSSSVDVYEDENECGPVIAGVYVGLFVQQSSWPLRHPRDFLVALLEDILTSADALMQTEERSFAAHSQTSARSADAKVSTHEESCNNNHPNQNVRKSSNKNTSCSSLALPCSTPTERYGDDALLLSARERLQRVGDALTLLLGAAQSLCDVVAATGYATRLTATLVRSVQLSSHALTVVFLRAMRVLCRSAVCGEALVRADVLAVCMTILRLTAAHEKEVHRDNDLNRVNSNNDSDHTGGASNDNKNESTNSNNCIETMMTLTLDCMTRLVASVGSSAESKTLLKSVLQHDVPVMLLNLLRSTMYCHIESDDGLYSPAKAQSLRARVIGVLQGLVAIQDLSYGPLLYDVISKDVLWQRYGGQRHDMFLEQNAPCVAGYIADRVGGRCCDGGSGGDGSRGRSDDPLWT